MACIISEAGLNGSVAADSPQSVAFSGTGILNISVALAETIHVTDAPSANRALVLSEVVHVTDLPGAIMELIPLVSLSAVKLTFADQGVGTNSGPVATVVVTGTGTAPLIFAATPVNILGIAASSWRHRGRPVFVRLPERLHGARSAPLPLLSLPPPRAR